MANAEGTTDELTRYLVAPCEEVADVNVLKWWQSRGDQFPNLSRMAIDFLCIPGTYFRFLYDPVHHI